MEDNDEFGDLYTDVLQPLATADIRRPEESSAPASFKRRQTDPSTGSDDDEILYGAYDSKFNSAVLGKTLPDKGSVRSNFGEEDGITISVEENSDDRLLKRRAAGEGKSLIEVGRNGGSRNSVVDGAAAGVLSSDQAIPGLSGKMESRGTANFDDGWDSDESEDDLEIVLNDNNRVIMGMERMKGMDDANYEEGEPLVVVADNSDLGHHLHHPHMIDEQEWGDEETGPAADGERKESGDATKPAMGGPSAMAAVPPKIGYNSHMYHHPLHSQFKYVRPGAAPIPSTAPATAGGPQTQVRPPMTMPTGAGRGRGDWRPTSGRGTVTMGGRGFGGSAWGGGMSGRGYGSGLDFTLPSHKTIFEVDIDGFEEKPWKLQGIDVSDFFNFGLNEESWKEYCKKLEHLRLETTMQGKIRVYESGRAEQDFDPDLPPELAAALGHSDFPSENTNAAKLEAGRPPLPVGRPIPVETGSIDRTPSADTRRLRFHDNDTIIEIFCGRSVDDDNKVANQEGNPVVEDRELDIAEHTGRSSNPSRDVHARKGRKNTAYLGGDDLQLDSDVTLRDQHDNRSTKKKSVVKPALMSGNDRRSESIPGDNDGMKKLQLSSSRQENVENEVPIVDDAVNNESVMDDGSPAMETEKTVVDAATGDTPGGVDAKIEGIQSPLEHLSQDSKAAGMSSENGKARSGSNFEDEVIQKHGAQAKSPKRQVAAAENARVRGGHHGKEEARRHHEVAKGRDDPNSRRGGGEPFASSQRRMKSEGSSDPRKESNEGNWRRRDEDVQRRSSKAEETRKREHGAGEMSVARDRGRNEKDEKYPSRNQVDKGSWRGSGQDQDSRSRQRDREDYSNNHGEKVDGFSDQKRKDGTYTSREHGEKEGSVFDYKESSSSSSRRKRERNDDIDQSKKDDHGKSRGVGQKEERPIPKERDERHRDHPSRKEREQTHTDVRSSRPVEEKLWRGKEKDHGLKEAGRRDDHVKKRDRSETEKGSQHRNEGGKDEKRPRNDVPASDLSKPPENRKKENKKKGNNKDSEGGDRSSLANSQRNFNDHTGQISETPSILDSSREDGVENKVSEVKNGFEASEDDSKHGRSKLERWTSQKEKDFGIPPSKKSNAADDRAAAEDGNNSKHLDTVEKLKKRSERFKLPMPGDTASTTSSAKKTEAVAVVDPAAASGGGSSDNRGEAEIKPERPPRKRRWTGN